MASSSELPSAQRSDEVHVRNANRPGFAMVPHWLIEDHRLGHGAVRLGAWLAGNSQEFVVRKAHARVVLKLGEDAWATGVKHLRAAGWLRLEQRRIERGRVAGQTYVFDFSPPPAPPRPKRP